LFRGIAFTFRFASHGIKRSFFSKSGYINQEGLTLSGTIFPPEDIQSVSIREEKFVLGLNNNAIIPSSYKTLVSHGNYIVLDLYRINPLTLKRMVEGLISKLKKTEEEQPDTIACPVCGSFIPDEGTSEYSYCPYCETLSAKGDIITDGTKYRMCEGCNLFGSVRMHKEFYCYAWLVKNRFAIKLVQLCTTCSSKLFINMLPVNLPFIIGLPATLAIPIRSYLGRDKRLSGLTRANRFISAKQTDKALSVMKPMLEEFPDHPGLLYNLAIGYLSNDNQQKAMDLLEQSLKACPSYEHSHSLFKSIENFIDGTC
jgi:hypothetical protein